MKKISKSTILFVLIFSAFSAATAIANPSQAPKKGYIQNDKGNKCWYTQEIKSNNTYFHQSLKGVNGVITFDDSSCMSDGGMGLDVNKMMINNVISRWYSHSDAAFQTRPSEMLRSSPLQIKGACIQSKTYPAIGITVDYFMSGKSIVGVIHGASVQGCIK